MKTEADKVERSIQPIFKRLEYPTNRFNEETPKAQIPATLETSATKMAS